MDIKRVKVRVDLWIYLLLGGSCLIFSGLVFTVPKEEMLTYFLSTTPMTILIIWILRGSYYELREDLLYMRIGPFFWKIKYDNIKKIKLTKNLLSSMALSIYRIEIIEHNKGFFRGTTMISPVNREAFLEELKMRCYHLEK